MPEFETEKRLGWINWSLLGTFWYFEQSESSAFSLFMDISHMNWVFKMLKMSHTSWPTSFISPPNRFSYT